MVESAGILAYRRGTEELEYFLVHPGGPFFAKRDDGWWTVPKGLVADTEDSLTAAKREFFEETGIAVNGNFIDLGYITQKGGKRVHCFAVNFDLDPDNIVSNEFQLQWPPGSGRIQSFAEVDKGGWFTIEQARLKINERQFELLVKLADTLKP